MNHTYFVIPGKTPELTKAELLQQLPHVLHDVWSLNSISPEALEIKSERPFPKDVWDRFGGVVKAGMVIETVNQHGVHTAIIEHALKQNVRDIGFSFYGDSPVKDILRFGLSIKRALKEQGMKVRIVTPQLGSHLSPVVTKKQLLDKRGIEICVISAGSVFSIGEVTWVHLFEEWGEREFSKPNVDKKRGLLPEKLARMMVNISGASLGPTIAVYDPFCGSGVVLIEARELGCKIYGSDIDEKAVQATKDNLGIALDDQRVWQADARFSAIPQEIRNGKGAIVCEPYLGPVWFTRPTKTQLDGILLELTTLYDQTLTYWKKHVPKGTPIVMVFPVIFGAATFPKMVDRLESLKYSSYTKPIRYERNDAHVARDIVRLVV